MLYLDDDINGFSLDEALTQLPAWRREAALRHRREADRRLSVAAYRLLCRGLRAEYGITEPPAFTFFVNHPDLVNDTYARYIENRMREAFDLAGTPIRLRFRNKKKEDGEDA